MFQQPALCFSSMPLPTDAKRAPPFEERRSFLFWADGAKNAVPPYNSDGTSRSEGTIASVRRRISGVTASMSGTITV